MSSMFAINKFVLLKRGTKWSEVLILAKINARLHLGLTMKELETDFGWTIICLREANYFFPFADAVNRRMGPPCVNDNDVTWLRHPPESLVKWEPPHALLSNMIRESAVVARAVRSMGFTSDQIAFGKDGPLPVVAPVAFLQPNRDQTTRIFSQAAATVDPATQVPLVLSPRSRSRSPRPPPPQGSVGIESQEGRRLMTENDHRESGTMSPDDDTENWDALESLRMDTLARVLEIQRLRRDPEI